MDTNELSEYVRKLNEQQAVIREQRRKVALEKIRLLRLENKYKEQQDSNDRSHIHHGI